MERIPAPKKIWLNGLLFVLTVFSTLFVGFSWSLSYLFAEALSAGPVPEFGFRAALDPRVFVLSLLYAAVLLTILVGHELGHYLTCRKYHIDATLPYFIPAPTLIGTLGAFIKIKSPIHWKHQLFDIGAGGPLASFFLSLPALFAGLAFSKAVPALPREESIIFGEPLLFKMVGSLFFGGIPDGYDIILHPVGFAGWVGILVTALNLLPIGQLDGGHIIYALIGKKSRSLSKFLIVFFIIMGVFFWVGWFIWALLVRFLGLKHPPIYDDEVPLSRGRKAAAVLLLVIFVLSFIPDPIRGFDGLTLFNEWLPYLKSMLSGMRLF